MRRRWADVSIAVSGVAVAAVSGAVSRAADVPDLEADVFHMVNDAPDALYPILWPLMQYGTFATIPVVAVVALVLRRWWFATATLLAGISVYLLAKGVKLVVDRGRPGAEIDDVRHLRGIGRLGYGFPSGHAAVSAALATIAWAYLPGAWRRAAVVLAAIVACTSAPTCLSTSLGEPPSGSSSHRR